MKKFRPYLLAISLCTAAPAVHASDEQSILLQGPPEGGQATLMGKMMNWNGQKTPMIGMGFGLDVYPEISLGLQVLSAGGSFDRGDDEVLPYKLYFYGLDLAAQVYHWRYLTVETGAAVGIGDFTYRYEDKVAATEFSSQRMRYGSIDLKGVLHAYDDVDVGAGIGWFTCGQTGGPVQWKHSVVSPSIFLRKVW